MSRHSLYHENQVFSILILSLLIETAEIHLTNLTLRGNLNFIHSYLLSPQADYKHLKEKHLPGSPKSCLHSTLYRTVLRQYTLRTNLNANLISQSHEEHKVPVPKWKSQEQILNNSCLNLWTKIGVSYLTSNLLPSNPGIFIT